MPTPGSVILPRLEISARSFLPTRYGSFETIVFQAKDDVSNDYGLSSEHVALMVGDVANASHVPVRVHSECITSEVFGSLKCDCKEQLEMAQAEISRRGLGVILYLRQEGRGIGLANKIRAYALQAKGADTVDANRLLGLPDDARKYDVAAAMLQELAVQSIILMTNNPEKVEALTTLGITIESRMPVLVRTTSHSATYLETKRVRMQHVLPARADLVTEVPV